MVMRHFGFTFVCINKYAENKAVEMKITAENDFCLAGRIPYDDLVMKSINELKPIVHYEAARQTMP